MNLMAGKLGLTSTTFANPHGLCLPKNLSTSNDVAVLSAFAM